MKILSGCLLVAGILIAALGTCIPGPGMAEYFGSTAAMVIVSLGVIILGLKIMQLAFWFEDKSSQ